MPDNIGQTIDRYQITAQVHKDRLSTIYKAFDPKFERNVTIYLIGDQQDQNRYFFTIRAHCSGLAPCWNCATFLISVFMKTAFIWFKNISRTQPSADPSRNAQRRLLDQSPGSSSDR